MATWHTLESARSEWIDAPLDDDQLNELLEVARDAVLAFAPALDGEVVSDDGYLSVIPDTIPTAYRVAQLMQARNVWNSTKASPTGDFDGGGFSLTTFPLDWQVKQLLRPRSVFGGPVG